VSRAPLPMPELAKAYEPKPVESKWYQHWLDQDFFTAEPARVSASRPAYSIVIPPPNVTGVLTLGHVLNNTIQDILARKARMEGKEVLWLPGTDHAGIATQNVVEKTLKKAGEIKHRNDLGREALVAKIWEWKENYGGIILKQLKALGASCDWTRTRFTMDPEYSRCVAKVFVDLYKKGLIYRGKRMVNWCPASLTALSDEEVTMKEQNGLMYYFKVEVAEEPGTFLTIATTRPETIPGDSAVAVNPKDPRYAKFIGKHVLRPLPSELPRDKKLIPIIGDEHVDFEFGTGVLKVTPAHDKADFEIGQRHKLPVVEVIEADGKMNALAGQDLAGLERFAARKIAAEKLRELGAMEKEEPYKNNVGYSERADVPVEPRLSEQWFLKYPSTEASRKVVAEGRMKFFPERWAKVYDHWLGGIQDWCISRQLWWGHRIPVWYRGSETYCGMDAPAGEGWTQDPDVLDTWFSSWLWPFATMNWTGDKAQDSGNADLRAFYPTTDLVTGPDIIFFWVARMIMAGYEYMGEMPFRNVYYTGIIRDKQGRKMSKSLGNSPDPLDLIAQYGADALRFGIMRSAPLGQDILFDEKNVELGRNFCNKLWNACRFRQMQGGEVQGEIDALKLRSDDKWILLKLHQCIKDLDAAFAEYKFSDATKTLYDFFWGDYCDYYVESCKPVFQGTDPVKKANVLAVMDFVLAHTLRLFQPFLPFITEELWHGMGYAADMPAEQGGRSIMHAPWPKPFDTAMRDHYALDDCYLEFVNSKLELIAAGRNLRRESKVGDSKKVRFILKSEQGLPPNDIAVIKALLNADPLDIDPNYEPAKGVASTKAKMGELYLPLEGLVDIAGEIVRLTKEVQKFADEITKVEQKLANPAFAQKVPATVLEEHRKRLEDWLAKKAHAQAALDNLKQG
jgi:valyl-tRNA synthetase